ncbi:MAG: tRNA (N(6)-L-threonylcarbamoyladenosine(37)-C(2))-methylthiotransferase MtaB [Oscillospiraceae bacterium]|nr:tRNA (N(6)-L-threonylcarbamoyladenosine(37)-C(2))-methylthiotransferase MtaB [Oscillospiraceae bacterium]
MKYAIHTLGCKVNQYETQAMEQLLTAMGHEQGSFEERCDCYIINTCTVTAVSDKKSRNIIRRVRKLSPDAVVGVCGCYAQTDPDAVEALDVDVLVGTSGREEFLQRLEQAHREKTRYRAVDDAMKRREFEVLPAGGMAARTRALIKVQDGCCNFCTYCIIPYARGPIRSLPLETAVAQAKQCAGQGYREIVVTGIEISSWGVDFKDGSSLKDLLAALCEAVPECRIRLGSLEPRTVDADFCRKLCRYENLCPQFHLSLQSGSDTVLKRMHRKYDTARYLESVRLLNEYFPGCAITTDVIVAFPGETEQEAQETLDFMRACRFALVHVFPYSRRAGTPAAKMPDQHPNAVKEARAAAAAKVASELETAYEETMIGKVFPVLFEQEEAGHFTGHAPNYVKVYVKEAMRQNHMENIKITALYRDGVLGMLEE